MRLFRYFETLLEPTALPPQSPPPAGLGAFYWHYARQARGLVVALFVAGFIVALIDTTIPVFLVLVVVRPLAMLLQNMLTNQAIIPGFSNLIRWQSHWHVVRQSWSSRG